jgi:hypothetical protein
MSGRCMRPFYILPNASVFIWGRFCWRTAFAQDAANDNKPTDVQFSYASKKFPQIY